MVLRGWNSVSFKATNYKENVTIYIARLNLEKLLKMNIVQECTLEHVLLFLFDKYFQ